MMRPTAKVIEFCVPCQQGLDPRADNESQGRSKKFAILRPRLRHVPQEVVRSRWDVAPQSVQDRIREVLKLIEKPVNMGQGSGWMGTAAQNAASSVLRTWVTYVFAADTLVAVS